MTSLRATAHLLVALSSMTLLLACPPSTAPGHVQSPVGVGAP